MLRLAPVMIRLHLMLPEILEERPALLRRPALEVRRVSDVDVERPAPRLGVRADHRVLPGQGFHLHAGALQALLARLRSIGLGRGVDAGEPVEHLSEPLRESLVRLVLIGEDRVAAIGRNLDGVQHARHRRLRQIGRVRVPDAAEVGLLVRELQHGRDHRALGQSLELRVLHRLAEATGEGELLARRELLVAKEDHQVVQQGLADLRDDRIGERRRDIHTVDLGAERSGHRLRFDVAVGPSGRASHHVSFRYSELK